MSLCMFYAELAVHMQHTVHNDHDDAGSEQPEQTNTSSADQPSKLVVKAFYSQRNARKPSRYLIDA